MEDGLGDAAGLLPRRREAVHADAQHGGEALDRERDHHEDHRAALRLALLHHALDDQLRRLERLDADVVAQVARRLDRLVGVLRHPHRTQVAQVLLFTISRPLHSPPNVDDRLEGRVPEKVGGRPGERSAVMVAVSGGR